VTAIAGEVSEVAAEPPPRPFRRRGRGAPVLLLAPFCVLFLAFFVIPIGYAIYESLIQHKVSGLGLGGATRTVVGFGNYSDALSDPAFRSGIERVLLFGVVQIPVMIAAAAVLALLLDAGLARFQRFFRLAYFLPYGIPGVIAAILWSFLYLPNLSPVVSILKGIGFGNVNFLGVHSVLWSIANIVTWSYTGYNMLIIYSGLQAIPRELYEAARLDGASEWRIAMSVKLPLVRPSMVLTAVFSIIGTLQLFSEPEVLRSVTTNISSTYTPNLDAYTQAFTFNNSNEAAAIAVVLAVATAILSFGFLKITSRRGWQGAVS
jgi:multiple sugar transport system permease protein